MATPTEDLARAREKFKEDFVSVVYETAGDIGDRIERAHGKVWAARQDVAKTILSLASGALVITLTFSERLVPAGAGPAIRWLIASSWLALLLSCSSAVLSLWISIKLRATPAMLQGQAEAAHDHVLAEAKKEDFDLRPAILESPFREVFEALEAADRNSYKFTTIALCLLLLSLALLAAAGIVHFSA